MADRVLFRWKGAAIMGDENGRPLYPRVGADFPGGSPVWGKGGAIAALLARVAEAEHSLRNVLLMATQAVRYKTRGGEEDWRHVIRFCAEAGVKPRILRGAGAPAAPPRETKPEPRWWGACLCATPPTESEAVSDSNGCPMCPRCGYKLGGEPTVAPPYLLLDEDDPTPERIAAALHRAPAAPPEPQTNALHDFAVVVAARTPPEADEECPLCRGELQRDARRLLDGDEACAADYRRAVRVEELAVLRASRAGKGESDG